MSLRFFLGPVPLAVAALALVMTGCADSGSDGSSAVEAGSTAATTTDPSPTATTEATPAAEGPACADVWSDGATLPRGYQGCVSDAGDFVDRDPLACSSGQRIIRFDDQYYAVPGGTIHQAAEPLDVDAEYRDAVATCRG